MRRASCLCGFQSRRSCKSCQKLLVYFLKYTFDRIYRINRIRKNDEAQAGEAAMFLAQHEDLTRKIIGFAYTGVQSDGIWILGERL